MRRRALLLLLAAPLSLALGSSCKGAGTSAGASAVLAAGAATGSGGSTCDMMAPTLPSNDWCFRLTPGGAGHFAVPLDIAHAHAQVRFFGVAESYAAADLALNAALSGDATDLDAYAQNLPYALCSSPQVKFGIPDAVVTIGPEKLWATIVPGNSSDPIVLPQGAEGLIVDLRKMPGFDDPQTTGMLEAVLGLGLKSDVPRPKQRVRRYEGIPAEIPGGSSAFSNSVVEVDQKPLHGTGSDDLALVLLTGPQMSPAAAELAGMLRLANRAWIFGEDLRTEVAESRWLGIGSRGVSYRYRDFLIGNRRWPDVIPADVRGDPDCIFAAGDLPKGPPPDLALGPDDRPAVKPLSAIGTKLPAVTGIGALRAALYTASGAINLFFPDGGPFPTPPPNVDGRLQSTLLSLPADPVDRVFMVNNLRRFGEVLQDGQQTLLDYPTPPPGRFLVVIEDIDGLPVVRRSAAPGVSAGDQVTTIDGLDVNNNFQDDLDQASAATDGYRVQLAMGRHLAIDGPTELGLIDADGVAKKATVTPATAAESAAFGTAPSLRKDGWLSDYAAPDLYYVNLAGDVLATASLFQTALTVASAAKGLVLDLRGPMAIDPHEVAARLLDKPFALPERHTPVLIGPDEHSFKNEAPMGAPLTNPSFSGKVVLITGFSTLGPNEELGMILTDAKRVTVVGRQSAGTAGDVTGLQLPGGFGFTFTGLRQTHAGGAPFLGAGVPLDVDVQLTAKALHDGIDPELQAAVTALGG